MQAVAQDLAFALRGFLRRPGVTVTALVSLALGIGVNSAIFSIADALLMRPLPYRDAGRLVILWNRSPGLNITEDWFSTAQYFDIKTGHDGFEQLAIAIGATYNLTGNGDPERVGAIRVSSNLLPMLGVRPEQGRLFGPADDAPGQTPAALLSWGMWKRRFGGAPKILGQAIHLNGQSYQVAGVLPRSFALPREVLPTLGGAESPEVLLPLPMRAAAANDRDHEDYNIIGKLKPGVTVAQARAAMETITSRLRREHPDLYPPNGGLTFDVVPLLEQVVGNVRYPLALLGAAAGFVLLIACANVANLQLSRSVARKREIGIRVALGAARSRIVRMLLTESVTLGLLGGALGFPLAMWCIAWMRTLGRTNIPRVADIGLSLPVILFTFLLCLIAGVLAGLVPALRFGQWDLNGCLKGSGRGASGEAFWGRRSSGRKWLVAGELALCTAVLIGAGLLVRSYAELQRVWPGFQAGNVTTFGLTMTGAKYGKAQPVLQTYDELWNRLERLPGNTRAGGVSALPLSQMFSWGPITIEGRVPPAGENFINADERIAGGHYFQAMRIPLRRGRFFDQRDTLDAPRVALIDEYMAQQFWPAQDPVGKRFHIGGSNVDKPWITVIGVVGRVKQYSLDADSRIAIYLPQTQAPVREMSVVVRSGETLTAAAIRETIRALDTDLPVYQLKSMDSRVKESIARQRFLLFLFELFALLALALALIGIYGLMAFIVSQGIRDIAIRVALGATGGRIRLMIARQAVAIALPGVACGVVVALAAGKMMQGLLFHIGSSDPGTVAGVSLLLLVVAAVAGYAPAREALRVDPVTCLRGDE